MDISLPGALVRVGFHRVTLPTPRSVNGMYRSILISGAVRVVKSKAHVAWLKEARPMLPADEKGLYKGSKGLIWTPTIYANVPLGSDLDNMAKIAMDLIAKHYGLDDGYHDEIHIYRVVGDTMRVQFIVQDTGIREG